MKIGTNVSSEMKSSFLSIEKDIERILTKLFFDNRPQNKELLRLLVIEKVNNTTLATLFNEGYIKLAPKIPMPEHEKVKAYIMISFDNFIPNGTNTEFRDCSIHFDIICHTDYWVMDNYQIRPLKIAGYIDGILNNAKLSGIGTLNFMGCKEIAYDEVLSGYTLSYRAIHGSDDSIPDSDD